MSFCYLPNKIYRVFCWSWTRLAVSGRGGIFKGEIPPLRIWSPDSDNWIDPGGDGLIMEEASITHAAAMSLMSVRIQWIPEDGHPRMWTGEQVTYVYHRY